MKIKMYIPKRIENAYNEFNTYYFMNTEEEMLEEKEIEYIKQEKEEKEEKAKRKALQEEKEEREKLEKLLIEIYGENYKTIFA